MRTQLDNPFYTLFESDEESMDEGEAPNQEFLNEDGEQPMEIRGTTLEFQGDISIKLF